MIFRGLDKDFVLLSEVPAINMQWRRRYYEFGDFEAQLTLDNYDKNLKYIVNTKTNEVAVVEKIEFKSEGHGNFVYLSGRFIESWLDRGVVIDELSQTRHIVHLCRDIVSSRVISDLGMSNISIGEILESDKTTDSYPDNETQVGTVSYKLLKSIDFSQKLRFDYNEKHFYYDIWQGIDRTIEGTEFCVFSDKLGTLVNLNYSNDDSNYKNFAIIKLNRGGDPEKILWTEYNWVKDDEPLRKIRVDYSQTDKDKSDDQAIAEAQEKAKLDLLNHRIVENANFKPSVEWLEYGYNYDMGDMVLFVVDRLGLSIAIRIIGIDEVYKGNNREITLQFGDLKKLNYRKR